MMSKNTVRVICLLVGMSAMFCGCEWESDDADLGSDIGLNVSGTYTSTGGVVVNTNPQESSQRSANIGVGDGSDVGFSGSIALPIVSGSVTVYGRTPGNVTEMFTSDAAGNLTSGAGGTGFVDHNSGVVTVTFAVAPDAGAQVMAQWQTQASTPGTTDPIYSFSVYHVGGTIEIVDNHGNSYMGTISSPNKYQTDADQAATDGSTQSQLTEAYPFEATGNGIKIVGSITATVTVYYSTATSGQGADQTTEMEEWYSSAALSMAGSWIDEGNGTSSSLSATGPSGVNVEIYDRDFWDWWY